MSTPHKFEVLQLHALKSDFEQALAKINIEEKESA